MPDYKKMNLELFNAVTTAVTQLQNAQRAGEGAYAEDENPPETPSVEGPRKKPEPGE